MRELRAGEGQGSQAYSGYFSEQILDATREFNDGRPGKALEIWRRMHTQYPDLSLTSEEAFNLFVDFGRHDEAEALIQDGRRRYPRYRSLYDAALARVAYRRGDLEEALRRYEALRDKFPQVADGYGIAAACLSDLGREVAAEAMLERGIRRLPNNYDLCIRHAQAATRRRDWPEALKRWQMISNRFEHLPGPLGVAQCLKELGRLSEAKEILAGACENSRACRHSR